MALMLFDFECQSCGHVFEELADRDAPESVKCVKCGEFSCRRLITGTRIDPKLGLDPVGFPTMGDAWARKRQQAAAQERKRKLEHGDR